MEAPHEHVALVARVLGAREQRDAMERRSPRIEAARPIPLEEVVEGSVRAHDLEGNVCEHLLDHAVARVGAFPPERAPQDGVTRVHVQERHTHRIETDWLGEADHQLFELDPTRRVTHGVHHHADLRRGRAESLDAHEVRSGRGLGRHRLPGANGTRCLACGSSNVSGTTHDGGAERPLACRGKPLARRADSTSRGLSASGAGAGAAARTSRPRRRPHPRACPGSIA